VLWERLSRGNRKHINQAQEKKVCVKSENTDLAFNKFWSVYSNLAQKKNFHILQRTVMRRVSQLAIASLYVAYVHERPAAVAIVLHSDSVARYWYGAGDPDYYSYRPSNLLHWQVMVDMKNAGCSVYDLGGSSPTNTFKAGFGARLCEQEKAEYRTLKGEMLARIPQRLIPVLKKVTG
jgi:lipid II:glycine glycyltransferase (peptidoglycan interpeptide bridge formation enzyme)